MTTRIALIASSWLLLFVGCASYYPISKQFRDEAAGGPSFTMVKTNPTAYIGKTVIWGGKIINTTNDSIGSQIMVLQTPLDKNGVPNSEMKSQGRFLAQSPSFLDPEIFKAGRTVTLAGTVLGAKSMLINKLLYNYPVINLKQIHIWKKKHTYYAYPYPGYWWGFGFDDGFDGFYDGFGGGFYGEFPDENHNHNGNNDENRSNNDLEGKSKDHNHFESGKQETQEHESPNHKSEGHNDKSNETNNGH